MANRSVREEGYFFAPIESLCRGPAITCDPDMDMVAVARLMKKHNISGVVVAEGGQPVGVVSVRDLRDLVAESVASLADCRAGDVMKTALVSIRHRACVFEAIFKMAKHNIHRLVVLDDQEQLFGVVTDTDLLSLQTRSPIYLNQELEGAESLEQLRGVNARLLDMVNWAIRAGAEIKSLVQLLSHFNDAFTLRIIELLEQEGVCLPAGVAYLALGSEGRGEQTLRTDQDSAVVYRDDLGPRQLAEVERFADRLVAALEMVGVPRCPGNTMASNPRWRHSLSGWKQLLNQWIALPKAEHMVNFGMFQDFRTIFGDESLERHLHEHLLQAVRRHALFLPYVARNIVRFPPPLGMFGRIRVERRGPARGKVDLKKAGIFALTEGVSLLALEAGIVGGSTWDKLEQLGRKGILSPVDLATVDQAFTYLVKLRLQRQLRSQASQQERDNLVDPLVMTDLDRDRFREALKGVGVFLKMIRDRYKLDFISR